MISISEEYAEVKGVKLDMEMEINELKTKLQKYELLFDND
jgi:hypothetical protein